MFCEKYQQKTIRNEISCVGTGLHSGNKILMVLKPAEPDTGVVFHRTDIAGKNAYIPAHHTHVVDTRMCTCIGDTNGVKVATIEHLMAAISAMGINNLQIDINGPETPVMDGSSAPFVFLIECAGVKSQNVPLKAIKVLKTLTHTDGDKQVSLSPADYGLEMHFEIDFPSPIIGHQEIDLDFSPTNFKTMFSRARTFGFLTDIEKLRTVGLARGGSLDNAILVNDDAIMNKEGLRYKDEFVRHKMLDAVGDLFMAGYPIIGRFWGKRSGHTQTDALLKALFSDKTAYEIVELGSYRATEAHEAPDIKLACA